jgi:hypothetical protein
MSEAGVDVKVVKWLKEFLVGRSQRVRVGGQLSEEDRVTSGAARERVRLFTVPCLCKRYLEEH